MLIDWFTTGAQIINFLILVWLLKRFLYKPILEAMDAREKQIDANLREAAEKKIEAEQQRANYLRQSEDLQHQQAEILKRAAEEAESTRQILLRQAREEVAALRAQWQEALKNEQEALRGALARNMEQEVFATIRKLLTDMAGVGLEERMAATLIHRLRELDPVEKARMKASLNGSRAALIVRSAFELPRPSRVELEQAIKTELGIDSQLEFQTAPDLIGGIEFVADGSKIAWTIEGYLSSLEKSLDAALETEKMTNEHG